MSLSYSAALDGDEEAPGELRSNGVSGDRMTGDDDSFPSSSSSSSESL